jgi:hypothetical protein
MTFVAWVVFPVVFYLLAAGLGLVAERVARLELPDALLAPVGACLALLIALGVIAVGGTGAIAGGALVVPALVGLVVGRKGLGARLAPGWPGIAALLVFALYMGPVVLSGHWTWLGYNFVNDTGNNFVLVDHLAHHGNAFAAGTESTRVAVINASLASGYPLGAHALLAALEWLVPAPVEAVYQPFIASLAAFAGMALAWLAGSVGVRGAAAAGAGFLAVGANLTYQWAMQGSFKEIAVIAILAAAAALTRLVLDNGLAVGGVALVGACLAAAMGVFTAGAAGYAVALAGVAVVAMVVERRVHRLGTMGRAVVVGPVVLLLAASPFLADAVDFAREGATVFANTNADLSLPLTSPAVLGNLARPLPIEQSLGTWLGQDYRYPTNDIAAVLTTAGLVLAGALIVFALFRELRGRRLGALLAFVPALVVYFVATPRLEPYADAKLLVIVSPMAVFAAAVGAWWVYSRWRAAGITVAVALAAGVIVSDALAYRGAHVVPVQRMEALHDAAEHGAGRGPWLFPEWEEYAKHFGKPAAVNVASESATPRSVSLREDQIIFNTTFDLDDMRLDYVDTWPGIMLRRSPENSRPPADYERTYRNAYYELWEKQSDGPKVLEHLPLQQRGQAAVPPRCQDVRDIAARVRDGERLVAARRDELPTVGVTVPPAFGTKRPDRTQWYPIDYLPGAVGTDGHGWIAGHLTVDSGEYAVWVKGGGGRALRVFVDGRKVGEQQQVNTPGQWLPMGSVLLGAGSHEVKLVRPGADLEPGNGVNGPIYGIALERVEERPLVTVAPEQAEARLCGRPWDWIERVSG